MYRAELHRHDSFDETFEHQWNRLLASSRNNTTGSYLKVLTNYRDKMAPQDQLLLIVVRDDQDQMVAGLPLLVPDSSRFVRRCTSVANEWFQAGQLLVAREADLQWATAKIVQALKDVGLKSCWLDLIPIDHPEWQSVLTQAREKGWAIQAKSRFDVGVLKLPKSWEEFEQNLSKNGRKRVRSEWKQITSAGPVELEVVSQASSEALSAAISTALEIELSGWKGRAGSAIACHSRIKDFYVQLLSELSRSGQARLFFLKLAGQAIAFDLGFVSGGYYRAQKVSFLEQFAEFAPGHVLNQLVVKHFIANQEVHTLDSVGPMNEANRRWSNDQYRIGRLLLAPGTWVKNFPGRSLVSLMNIRTTVKRNFVKHLTPNRNR